TVTGAAVNSNVVISGLTFESGSLPTFGGAILITDSASPLLSNSIITANAAITGGGIYAHMGSLLRLQGVQFAHNVGIFDGGGAYAGGGASVSNSIFLSNTASA